MLPGLLADLRAETADLAALVAGADLSTATPADGWDVRDAIAHLAGTDEQALLAVRSPEVFVAGLTEIARDIDGFLTGQLLSRRELPAARLLAEWQAGAAELATAIDTLPAGTVVPWYGPPMSPASFATARLMETWAHGQDVADGLGLRRVPTGRLRHVCHLGVRTRGFSYGIRSLPVPPGDVRVALTAPDGEVWEWGSGPDAVQGSALEFCLLVTQRRHRDDLGLVATGPLADSWLDVAQCFAGPPGPGRAAGAVR